MRREIVSFYNIIESDHVDDVSEEFDRLIEIASQKERYRLLADKEEELIVSSLLLFFTCSGSYKSLTTRKTVQFVSQYLVLSSLIPDACAFRSIIVTYSGYE